MLSQQKSPSEIESMRTAGKILAEGLQLMAEKVLPGTRPVDIAEIAHQHVRRAGAEPAFLGYPGSSGAPAYPNVACISVNDAVVHGIPGNKSLKNGDVVSLDLGVKVDGMITDGAITVIVGQADPKDLRLVETTREALFAGLKTIKDGCKTGDIGEAIQSVLSEGGYGIVRDLVGHGVGYGIHEDPNIPNFGSKGKGSVIKAGMTLAVEPMATLGGHKVYIDHDGWTVRTADGSKAAHFEHTILVTKNGYEILTSSS